MLPQFAQLYDYQAIDNGVHLRANSVRALIATCLNASQKSEVVFGLTHRPGSSVESSGSGVELRTLDYENPGSNSVLRC